MVLPTACAEQLQAAEKLGSNIMSPEIEAEFLERIQQQMNDIAQVLDQRAQYFVLSGSFFTLVLKDFLVSKQCITEKQAAIFPPGPCLLLAFSRLNFAFSMY